MDRRISDDNRMAELVEASFGRKRILVFGDLMLDRYLWGDVDRISPEAPVPVVRIRRRTDVAGGAANVAANLAGLGLTVAVAGPVGRDTSGDILMHVFEQHGIDTEAVLTVPGRQTVTKTRILGGHQQMMRMDEEDPAELDTEVEDELLDRVLSKLMLSSAVLLSDYAKGTLSARACRTVIDVARSIGIPILVDPKGNDYSKYARATVITPNMKELSQVMGVPLGPENEVFDAAKRLRAEIGIEAWAVTRGERGITLIDANGVSNFPAIAREVYDVSGAGDTVIAALAAGIIGGLEREESIQLANLAAGVVVGKIGTSPLCQEELLEALRRRKQSEQAWKIMDLNILLACVDVWRARGERIVFTNGCFDIVHAGHVTYLERARQEGSRLIVGLNSDSSVRALKGVTRPIMPQQDRARVLASLASVDAVILFEDDTPIELIKAVQPDVLVKGSDYSEDEVVGAQEASSWRGRVVLVPQLEGRSTSQVVSRIRGTA
jgi:D-beta-D-heptose 7-phosphate kinase/D-beta-D-heptose 1-phosphate adenosyltransferase